MNEFEKARQSIQQTKAQEEAVRLAAEEKKLRDKQLREDAEKEYTESVVVSKHRFEQIKPLIPELLEELNARILDGKGVVAPWQEVQNAEHLHETDRGWTGWGDSADHIIDHDYHKNTTLQSLLKTPDREEVVIFTVISNQLGKPDYDSGKSSIKWGQPYEPRRDIYIVRRKGSERLCAWELKGLRLSDSKEVDLDKVRSRVIKTVVDMYERH